MDNVGGIRKFRAIRNQHQPALLKIRPNEALTEIATAAGCQNIVQCQRAVADRDDGIGLIREGRMIAPREFLAPVDLDMIFWPQWPAGRRGTDQYQFFLE